MEIMHTDLWAYVILPVLIFCSRICDMTLDTMRIISISKGKKALVPVFAFFEVIIWLLVISQILNNMSHWFYYIVYAAGFAAGNYVGMTLEEKITRGKVLVKVFFDDRAAGLLSELKDYKTLLLTSNSVYLVLSNRIIKNIEIILAKYPGCYYCVEDIKFIND